MGSNLGESKLNLLFCQNFIWHEGGRAKETLVAKRGWKTTINGPSMTI